MSFRFCLVLVFPLYKFQGVKLLIQVLEILRLLEIVT